MVFITSMNFLYQCWILPVSGLFYILFVISIFSYQNCYRTHNYIFNFSHHNFWIHFIFSYFKISKHQIINKVKRQVSKSQFICFVKVLTITKEDELPLYIVIFLRIQSHHYYIHPVLPVSFLWTRLYYHKTVDIKFGIFLFINTRK